MSDGNNNILNLFFEPRNVCVIGASKSPFKGGNRIINNLKSNNYKGEIYPVNPNANGDVYGYPFLSSVLDIEESVDLAILYVGNRLIPQILKDCIKKGIKAALIQASGFSEVGKAGIALKEDIIKITDNFSKIRIVGPNCMGLSKISGDYDSDEKGGFFSGFGVLSNYKRGNISIITQSGMLNGGFISGIFNLYPNTGFRYICSIGNKMDLGENEFLEYILEDDTVNVIAIYLENFKEPRKFISLCKKAKTMPNKTIILVRGGVTSQGQNAALSHTGSLAENTQLINAIIKQSCVIEASSFHEMFQFARTFSMMYKSGKIFPKLGNIGLVIGSGGAGTVFADLAMRHGLKFPEFGKKSFEILKSVFPEWMPPNRFALVDTWPTIEKAMMDAAELAKKKAIEINSNNTMSSSRKMPEEEEKLDENKHKVMSGLNMPGIGNIMRKIQEAVLGDPKIEGLFSMMPGGRRDLGMEYFELMLERIGIHPKPIFFWTMIESEEFIDISRICGKFNIPVFSRTEELVKNFAILVMESKNKEKFRTEDEIKK
ncbi:MAG: CoA-binding protein [Promethearchaeota archaeon]